MKLISYELKNILSKNIYTIKNNTMIRRRYLSNADYKRNESNPSLANL